MKDIIYKNDYESEQAVLGSIIVDPGKYELVLSKIKTPKTFYNQQHQYIFRCMMQLKNEGKMIDEISISDELKKIGKLEDIGGLYYISTLEDCVPSADNLSYYAELITDKYISRQLVESALECAKSAGEEDKKATFVLDEFIQKMIDVRTKITTSARAVSVFDIMPDIISKIERVKDGTDEIGYLTGYSEFDRMLGGGLQREDLIFIGAQPSVGKTSLGCCLSFGLVSNRRRGIIISIESSKESIVQDRLLPAILEINSHKLKRGDMEQRQWDDLIDIAQDDLLKNVKICDESTLTINDIYSMCNLEYLGNGIDFLLLDYTQLITPTKTTGNRNNELGEIARGLKRINKDFGIPIVALSQLNKENNLRDSGELLAVADVKIVLERSEEDKNIINCDFQKNRNGLIGAIDFRFEPKYTKFYPVEEY